MKKLLIITALALTACTAEAPLYLEVARSEMSRCPEGSYIDSQNGNLKWNYTTGLELKALLDAYAAAGSQDDSILKYADAWYDAVIDSAGAIGGKYKKSNYSLDHICPGNTLFDLYGLTGKEKYRKAMDSLYVQLREQPRNAEGGFWHKKIYPGQ
ncbi:MAG: glycoside hydrolase family 88 protein, partial [Bacteroidales bacterium]|nr:glycoside hydrolase family 88 protein [Bacteroidales bacterium]